MATPQTFIIVGAGLAGAKAAEALRAEGFDGAVVLLGDEPHRPYERPPLSKDYLTGASPLEKIFVHPETWYADHGIDLRPGSSATAVDPIAHQLLLTSGQRMRYDKLLLATGSSPRRLPVPGADANGVLYLRRLEDADRIKDTLAEAARIAVIGAGWIGLEVTAAARTAGVDVTLLERSDQPLLGLLGAEVARVFADLHRDHGVDLRLGATVAEITTDQGRATGIRLADGEHIPADAVIVGVGVTPNTAVAERSGLHVHNGVVVDASLRTSDPDIYAAGDVASAYHPILGGPIRVDHWANALHQPTTAAQAMLGQDAVYARLPYFFTDQYDLGMEYVGHTTSSGYDQLVVRGDLRAREFIAFWLSAGRVVAGMNLNIWGVTDALTQLIQSRAVVDTTRLADPNMPLDELATPPNA